MTIDEIIGRILQEEGSAYTDNPADSGGPTKYGITQATLSEWRGHAATPADVQALTEAEAQQIYRAKYYTKPGYDKVAEVSPAIAAKLTDAGVNMGTGTASGFLQRALNLFATNGANLAVDGVLGAASIAQLQWFMAKRGAEGEQVLLRVLNAFQAGRYAALAESNPKNREFIYGWILNRVN